MNKSLQSIQILRAIACISVVYSHITLKFGTFGLDIFFVISGFVMAKLISNNTRPKKFIIDRISRIIPLYWLLTTLLILITIFFPKLLNTNTFNFIYYLKSIFFIPYYNHNNYLQPLIIVGWTLNYEIFFYFCIFFSIIINKKKYYLIVLFFFIFFNTIIKNFYIENIYELIIFFSNPIIFEFFFGIIAFYLYKFNRNLIIKPYKIVILSVISYGFMAYYETNNTILNDYLRLFFYGIPSFTLVLSLCFLEKCFIKNSILTKKIIDIGNASYSIYLTHLFVLGFVNLVNYKLNIINVSTFTGSLLIIFLCIIIGKLTYDFIDKPISNYTKKILYLKFNNYTIR